MMYAGYYTQDEYGLWQEITLAEDSLQNFSIDEQGQILYKNNLLKTLLQKKREEFDFAAQEKQRKHEEDEKRHREAVKRCEEERREQTADIRQMILMKKQQEEKQAEAQRREQNFQKNMAENFTQQDEKVYDAQGNRWLKCEYCGKIAMDREFVSYGGANHENLGMCRECERNGKTEKRFMTASGNAQISQAAHRSICPICGGKLREKQGRYGKFFGCSNFPKCRYTENFPNR
jgi:hypothetical protein